MVVLQGDLLWVKLPVARGSEPAGHRPALVLQGNGFNKSRINTVIIAAITSNLKYANMPGNVSLKKGEAGMPKASVINLSQLHSIDRQYVEAKIGSLSGEKMKDVVEGLRLIFDF